jgi:hypothetical protein
MKQGSKSRRWLRPLIEELERRLLLSADVESVLLDPGLGQPERARDPAAELDPLEKDSAAGEIASVIRRELIFVDAGVEGYERLVEDLRSGGAEGHSLEVVVLDPERDGVAQITETLARFQDLDAVHILSHGSEGAVQLGSATLSSETLDVYDDALAAWGNALGSKADLLFYGCDLAGGEGGAAFVDSLAELTGADVAASIDLTGSALLGGDWGLEYERGAIETGLAFGDGVQQTWSATLAAPVVDDQSFSLDENAANGTVVGTVVASDPDIVAGNVVYEGFTEAKRAFDANSLTVSTPAGVGEGDLLIAAISVDSDRSISLSPPGGEGWTEIRLDANAGTMTFGVWWKIADASEPASHQWTWGSFGQQAYGWMMRFTGHDPADPIDASASSSGTSSSPVAPSVTTTVADALILRLGGFDDNDVIIDSPGLDTRRIRDPGERRRERNRLVQPDRLRGVAYDHARDQAGHRGQPQLCDHRREHRGSLRHRRRHRRAHRGQQRRAGLRDHAELQPDGRGDRQHPPQRHRDHHGRSQRSRGSSDRRRPELLGGREQRQRHGGRHGRRQRLGHRRHAQLLDHRGKHGRRLRDQQLHRRDHGRR